MSFRPSMQQMRREREFGVAKSLEYFATESEDFSLRSK